MCDVQATHQCCVLTWHLEWMQCVILGKRWTGRCSDSYISFLITRWKFFCGGYCCCWCCCCCCWFGRPCIFPLWRTGRCPSISHHTPDLKRYFRPPISFRYNMFLSRTVCVCMVSRGICTRKLVTSLPQNTQCSPYNQYWFLFKSFVLVEFGLGIFCCFFELCASYVKADSLPHCVPAVDRQRLESEMGV